MLNPPSTPMLILAALGSHNGAKPVLKLFSFLQYSTVLIVEVMNSWNKCHEIMVVKFGLSEKHTKFEKIFLVVWKIAQILLNKCDGKNYKLLLLETIWL